MENGAKRDINFMAVDTGVATEWTISELVYALIQKHKTVWFSNHLILYILEAK